MNMEQAVRSVLSQYANFNGRARRSEYWFWYLTVLIVYIVAAVIDAVIGTQIFIYVVALAVIVPTLAVGARRLHDTDKSGWFQLISIIPIIGTIILIVFFATDSKPDNRYGPNPKGAGAGGQGMAPPAAPYGAPPTA